MGGTLDLVAHRHGLLTCQRFQYFHRDSRRQSKSTVSTAAPSVVAAVNHHFANILPSDGSLPWTYYDYHWLSKCNLTFKSKMSTKSSPCFCERIDPIHTVGRFLTLMFFLMLFYAYHAFILYDCVPLIYGWMWQPHILPPCLTLRDFVAEILNSKFKFKQFCHMLFFQNWL